MSDTDVEGETRRQRFERLAQARMNRILTNMRLLGNLSSNNYHWKAEDVRTMTDALIFAVNELRERYDARARKQPALRFSFPTPAKKQEA